MWIEYCAAVFGVKLYADKPFVFRQFNDFYQIGFGIDWNRQRRFLRRGLSSLLIQTRGGVRVFSL